MNSNIVEYIKTSLEAFGEEDHGIDFTQSTITQDNGPFGNISFSTNSSNGIVSICSNLGDIKNFKKSLIEQIKSKGNQENEHFSKIEIKESSNLELSATFTLSCLESVDDIGSAVDDFLNILSDFI